MDHSQLSQINELKAKLLSLGYHSYQLTNILRDTVNTSSVEDLSSDEAAQFIDVLQGYVDFANKSHKGIGSKLLK